MFRTHRLFSVFALLLWTIFTSGPETAPAHSVPAGADSPRSPAIVIGFVGGFVRRNAYVHSEVQLAARLRQDYSSGVYVEVFENHRGQSAYEKILQLLDTGDAGKLTPEQKKNARIILYGHSWGGSEAISVARKLESDGIPVLLTVQVDSVSKLGEGGGGLPTE